MPSPLSMNNFPTHLSDAAVSEKFPASFGSDLSHRPHFHIDRICTFDFRIYFAFKKRGLIFLKFEVQLLLQCSLEILNLKFIVAKRIEREK